MANHLTTIERYEALRDKAFWQCRQLASDFGFSISPRCRLAIPNKEEKKTETEEERMFGDVL